MTFLTRVALYLTRLSERYIPSAFVIACILSFLTLALAWVLTPKSLGEVLGYWREGFWVLLSFGMQMCLVLMTGSIIADSPQVHRVLDFFARLPKTDRQAVVYTAGVSMLLCWLHWGLGIVMSAFLARCVAQRRPQVDFRLLVAVAYFGMGAVWHAGLSGSAPILVATPNHFLEKSIGIIPLSETVFSTFNLLLTGVTAATLMGLAWAMYPSQEKDIFRLSASALSQLTETPKSFARPPNTWLYFWEASYAVPLALGAMGLAALAVDMCAGSFRLTLDKLNFLFLIAGILLHPSPASFVRAAERAASYVHGIIIQFPLYAGMFGVIQGCGLDALIAGWFMRIANAHSFPLIVYWYSGVLNYFVPSGGSKWAIEAPYLLEASRSLEVSYSKIVLAYAWGDMLTDLIQPFWCIPLLAVARLEFKDILGYEVLAFLICAFLGSIAFII